MPWEDPEILLMKKLGREEYCQRMLTSLILGRTYPRWNTSQTPSVSGVAFLQELHTSAFGQSIDEPLEFIDEFELGPADDKSRGGAPDYAIRTPSVLWIIELKTESGSHRRDQLPLYAKLAAYHYPNHFVEIMYITPEMPRVKRINGTNVPFRHVYWSEILDSIARTWVGSGNTPERRLVAAIQREIGNLHLPPKQFRESANVIRQALKAAESVQKTGVQVGVEVAASGLEALHDLRLRIRDALRRNEGYENVRPWIWYAATSGGMALTRLGADVGCELRLSRYER